MKVINQLAVLLLFWALGELAGQLLTPVIRFPGTVLGMVLLFTALAAGWVREEQIGAVSEFFLGNIGFFFVPVVVSLVTVAGLAPIQMVQLTVASILSTVITLALTGLAVQVIIGQREVK